MFFAYGLASFLRGYDKFGQNVVLKINGNDEIKSLLGAAITFSMMALAISLSFGTLLDYINQTNPTISTSIDYSSQNLTINYTNFFFGISFFYPLRDVRTISAESNDFSSIKYINQLNISCTTCEGEYLSPSSIMSLCNPAQFKNIRQNHLE